MGKDSDGFKRSELQREKQRENNKLSASTFEVSLL